MNIAKMKTKNYRIACIAMFAWACGIVQSSYAQQKVNEDFTLQDIVSPVKEQHDSIWYAHQAESWKIKIDENPQDEEAWKNFYQARRYQLTWFSGWNKEAEHTLNDIIDDMEKNIPDTQIYNLIKYTNSGATPDSWKYMEKAIAIRPNDLNYFSEYAAFLMMTGKDKELTELCKKMYESGKFSPTLLNYAYNEMAGMESDGIIFTNGDIPVYSKILIQKGKGLFKNIRIICTSFLWVPEYLNALTKELNIPPYQMDMKKINQSKDYRKAENDIVRYIASHTSRATYLSTTYYSNLDDLKDSLYSEGLIMRYSPKSYDNMSIKKRNFEKIYLTDYLRETFQTESYTGSAQHLNLNYIPCFRSLLVHYRQTGNIEQYSRLKQLLLTVVNRAELDNKSRKEYIDCIEEYDENN